MKVIPCPHLGLDDDESVSRTVPVAAHRCYARRPAAAVDSETQKMLCLSGRYAECPYCPAVTRSGAVVPAALPSGGPVPPVAVLNLPPPKWAAGADRPGPAAQNAGLPPAAAATAAVSVATAAVSAASPSSDSPPSPALAPVALPSMVRSEAAWGAAHPPVPRETGSAAPTQAEGAGARSLRWLWLLLPLGAGSAFVALLLTLGGAWLRLPVSGQTTSDAAVAPTGLSATATPSLSATAPPAPSPTADPAILVAAPPVISDRFATATAVPGGKVVTLGPAAGVAGWWASGEQRGRLGDSFLYAGRYAGQEFLSAARFDLRSIPRGAPLEQVVLRLAGLNGDRLALPNDTEDAAETTWLVQLVSEAAAAELERSDYLMALSAPAAITLPPLRTGALAAGEANTFDLDAAGRGWLAQQLLDGAASVVVRIIASGGTGDTLFAWDSGQGPESAGNAPALVISYGVPPPTPPPLPTKPFVVATLTPVPANALTVVAQAATATAQAALVGTATELPYQVYTPTPIPENLETVQAVAARSGLPAVLLLTPTPANAATATEQAAFATAVALTTGTFTPVPTGFVTPIVIAPSPPAQNVATAAARALTATAAAQAPAGTGLLPTPTPTPLPFNAVLGVYVYATPNFIPTNEATAVAYYRQLNDAILATGTPTPLPWNAIIITVVPTPAAPTPTEIPLFIPEADLSPTPTPTPTGTPPSELPTEVRDKILFKSNRSGAEAVYMLDPATGEVTLITQPWVIELAQGRLAYAPDGANRALVRQDDNARLQIFNESLQYGTVRKVTALGGDNYDPAWSPAGGWIAFVSTETGGDEIYRVDPEGTTAQRLTANTWEWDKHPSWSPDGSQIVFFSNREVGRRQLWIMDADGGNQRNLSSNEFEDWDPIWVR